MLQRGDGSVTNVSMLQTTVAAPERQGEGRGGEAAKAVWIRPWDSVFDRKKNGFGTFFAKQVLQACHCDEATILRVLGISMRHIAVKKSELVQQPPLPLSLPRPLTFSPPFF